MATSRALKASVAMVGTALVATLVALLTTAAKPAHAAFPGSNGAIAFASGVDDYQIYRMAPDGFGGAYSARLTDSRVIGGFIPIHNILPAWNAEGTRIAFVSDRDVNANGIQNAEIYRMDASGNNETNLTNNPAIDTYPAWFPTDTKLAFTSNRPDAQNTTDNEIYVMTLDENANPVGSLQRLTTSPASDEQPAVSPSGTLIAFASKRDGDFEIYAMKANARESATNRPKKLTNNTVYDGLPDWSPNGQRIVFESERSGSSTEREIVVMNSDGSGQKLLTNNTFDDRDPVFSPDGRRIAFQRVTYQDSFGAYQDIIRMRADGANQFNLTSSTNIDDANPSWQPN